VHESAQRSVDGGRWAGICRHAGQERLCRQQDQRDRRKRRGDGCDGGVEDATGSSSGGMQEMCRKAS
jgi:hypothetical protein